MLSREIKIDSICIVTPESPTGRLRQGVNKFGVIWGLLKILSSLYHKFSESSFSARQASVEKSFFEMDVENVLNIVSEVHYSKDINSEKTISWFVERDPSVVCFLGGDIVRKPFFKSIDALILNYHSGISPLFNGSGIAYHCCANGRPNFCGGTLMVMNERIDGGNILSYYFPEINKEDNSTTLFLKGIAGSVELYSRFVKYYLKEKKFNYINQPRNFLYYKSNDWTIWEDLKLREFENSRRIQNFVRTEKIIELYNKKELDSDSVFGQIINQIIKD
jgi:methionyl-tRNA formyltransferase